MKKTKKKEAQPSPEATAQPPDNFALIVALSSRITALEQACDFYCEVLEGQGQVNTAQVKINLAQETRNVRDDMEHEEIDAFLNDQVSINADVLADVSEIDDDVVALQQARANERLIANAHLSQFLEFQRYLNVERVPVWEWNPLKSQFETGYMLRQRAFETPADPFSIWHSSTGEPFRSVTVGGNAA